ncbi:nuclear transport factor 2 family protein [Hymenobacter sp. NST-14]|uniref:nuclear transport factor 2 family protein n=1 Tax=Hymenobacter piscis TaxID=2839984 RepID=UPI001C01A2AF|nr:nuclear transport factor 2 family protein [Hymenobacter piscis]MBT9395409.1 nuclear transport factor 2 family protein [Hymenobacter piscis]
MLSLPTPLAAYMQAVNARNTAAALRCFTPQAHVHDDGHHYHGQAEIGAWLTRTQQATPFTQEATHVEAAAAETVVTLRVTGRFPCSPLTLQADFRLADDLIRDLRLHG